MQNEQRVIRQSCTQTRAVQSRESRNPDMGRVLNYLKVFCKLGAQDVFVLGPNCRSRSLNNASSYRRPLLNTREGNTTLARRPIAFS